LQHTYVKFVGLETEMTESQHESNSKFHWKVMQEQIPIYSRLYTYSIILH